MADSLRRPVVRSPKTSEVIARDLAARIAEGGLAPGSRLPVERVMLESLGVGRTTLREALRLLETRGVLLETLKSIADGTTVGVEYTPRRRRAVAAAHQAVIDRLTAGDAEGSAEAMRRHLTEAAHYWRSRYPELYDSPVRWVG